MKSHATIFVTLALPWVAAQDKTFIPDADGFEKIARPYFKKHCLECHGSKKEKGDLNLETQLQNTFLDPAEKSKWDEILNSVNSHEMPPEDEPQPDPKEAAVFADWVLKELTRAEISKKSNRVVLRRLNRAEYVNTIRDLLDIDFDPEFFPEDPPAAGFDNIGTALTLSPLHLELYYDAARQIIDDAIVTGGQPPSIKWRFEPEISTKGADRTRVERGNNRILLNMGNNKEVDGFTVLRISGWDRNIGFRDFKLEHPGEYLVRFHAASRVPTQAELAKKATKFVTDQARKEAANRNRPVDQSWLDRQIEHFKTDPMYRYGPGRLRIEGKLGGQPAFVRELDIEAIYPNAQTYEVKATFDTSKAGLQFLYAYQIPKVLENHGFQRNEDFPRPEVLLDWIELEGPVYEQWPPRSHQLLLDGLPKQADRSTAKKLLTRFMTKAWRRLASDTEVEKKLALFDSAIADNIEFIEAFKLPLVATLTSPNFLFISEPGPDPRPLNSSEIATRLSYFLWSSMPDEKLTSAELTSKREIIAQVDRLLAHVNSSAFAENFAGQWLDLRKIGSNPPASDLFPRYDRHLEKSIAAESIGFFSEILHQDLDVRNFIRSNFVTINERLARFYNIPGVKGDHIRKVKTPPGIHRGGIATQASILSVTSNGTRTSPVVRGTWILKNLLDSDPGLPVANAGEISPKVPGIDKATVRKRLEIHRELPQCARCHDKIDPLGFALENYNAAGEWRLQEGFGYKGRIGMDDPPIDASARMPDGSEFIGIAGLQKQLLKKEDLFLRCLAKKLYTYALGREMGHSDTHHLESAVAYVKKNNYTLRSLIHFIATSEPFLTK